LELVDVNISRSRATETGTLLEDGPITRLGELEAQRVDFCWRRPVRFEDLPRPTRAEVERLAGRGQIHPDPAIAESALEWASRTASNRGSVEALFGLVFDVGTSLLGGFGGGATGGSIAKRRLAKRLLKISNPRG
jgi:hypothetical protein